MKLENGYWIDENKNRWSADLFSKEEVEEYSSSLIGCKDCLNCKNCVNCRWCVNCIFCNFCKLCEYCKNCENCDYCESCNHCCECKKCYRCTCCSYCENCSTCIECISCDYCADCLKKVDSSKKEDTDIIKFTLNKVESFKKMYGITDDKFTNYDNFPVGFKILIKKCEENKNDLEELKMNLEELDKVIYITLTCYYLMDKRGVESED